MKYLKSFHIFENSTYSEMKADIMDICQELVDGGKIKCDITTNRGVLNRYQPCDFTINLFTDKFGEGFHITTVIEYLVRIKDYLGELYGGCGLKLIDRINFRNERNRIDIDLDDERKLIGELYGHLISDIEIYVKPDSVKESFSYSMSRKYTSDVLLKIELLKRDISDMLLELGDLGFEWSAEYSPLTKVGRDEEPKLVIQVFGPSGLFSQNKELFHDVTERVKEFAKSSGYATGEAMNNDYQSSQTREDEDYYKMYQLLIQ